MNIIFGVGKHLFVWETKVTKAAVRRSGDEVDEEEEGFEHVPVDPHGTNGAHMEISPAAIFEGAQARRFGFHGSEGTSR